MDLSSDELEILDYLRCRGGEYVAIAEICRRAGGRKKFLESPNWAKNMMSRLVEGNLLQVDERGHFRFKMNNGVPAEKRKAEGYPHPDSRVSGEDYFPRRQKTGVVDDNYFPPTEPVPQIIDESYFLAPKEHLPEMKEATDAAKTDLPTSHIVDEDYFPAPEAQRPQTKQ
ncbi:hypothetical protein Cflav_PD5112 [Pedosphaera parvula Ellin514]|uniref:Uncharacterized protein n=2 Tax=Pedosphaera TaxID=1032526 RepID=B9XC09_PEDPL|nr:hypothetical protein Cflav_PD5112 [Pedosphaera parvula Ellin514]